MSRIQPSFPLSKASAVKALRHAFHDFARQESPGKDWWILERNIAPGVSERITISVVGSSGFVRFVPQIGLRFEVIARTEVAIWADARRADWHMPAGLSRSMVEFTDHMGQKWSVVTENELQLAVADIRTTYLQKVSPILDSLVTIGAVCDWFDAHCELAEKYAPAIQFAIFNLVGERFARAREIAMECKRKSMALPPVHHQLTMKMRLQFISACNRIIDLTTMH